MNSFVKLVVTAPLAAGTFGALADTPATQPAAPATQARVVAQSNAPLVIPDGSEPGSPVPSLPVPFDPNHNVGTNFGVRG